MAKAPSGVKHWMLHIVIVICGFGGQDKAGNQFVSVFGFLQIMLQQISSCVYIYPQTTLTYLAPTACELEFEAQDAVGY